MRTLAWAAFPFAAATFLAEYLLPVEGLPFLSAAFVVCALLGLLLRSNARRRAMLSFFAAAFGLLWFWGRWQLTAVPAQSLSGQERVIEVRVTEYPQTRENGLCVNARLCGDGLPKLRCTLYLDGDAAFSPEPGDIVRVRAELLYAGEDSRYYTGKNIWLLAFDTEPAQVTGQSARWLCFPQRAAEAIRQSCEASFPPDVSPLMTALLLGDKQALKNDLALYADMGASGVLHAVAVSGMHLVYIVGLLQLLLGRSRRASLLCLPFMLLFVLMTGCPASVLRAAVMESFLLLAPVFDRENDGVTSLGAALALLLLINPRAAGDWGLQLSFCCAAGLILLSPPLGAWCAARFNMKNKAVSFLVRSLLCTLCALLPALPLMAVYFGSVSLLSWLANLLTLGVLSLCFAAGFVLCLLGLSFPGAASALGWVFAWPLRYCMAVYGVIGDIPFANLYTADPLTGWWLALFYAVLLAAWLLRKRTGGFRPALPLCVSVLALCALLLTQSLRFRGAGDGGAVTVLDVGQGQCAAILTDGAAVLVDCGGDFQGDAGNTAADYLFSAGYDRVELLVLTHLHEDHANGVLQLMSRMDVLRIAYPADADAYGGLLPDIVEAAERCGAELCPIAARSEARVGGFVLTLYTPQAGTDENERGLVVRAAFDGGDALIMGDAGRDAEFALITAGGADDARLLVVGHHGSGASSSAYFLECVDARTAVISVGENSYGQPADETLARLDEFCGEVLRTDMDGAVTVPMGD